MNTPKLTWLHLSDLHMEAADRFDRTVVLNALWTDLKRLATEGLSPDFIVFSGDVAYHGFREEYELAKELFFLPLLSVTRLDKKALFLVPGNHDVNRRLTARLQSPFPIASAAQLAELVDDPEFRDAILTPLTAYCQFHTEFLDTVGPGDVRMGYASAIEIDKDTVQIVCLNSAWLCGFNKSSAGDVEDCGHLAISERAVHPLLRADARLNIVIAHHPLDWLLPPDRAEINRILRTNPCVLLHGHLHQPNVMSDKQLLGGSVTIPAGAVFDRRQSPNAYNITQLDPRAGTLTICLRAYNNDRCEWQKDTRSTGDLLDGQVIIDLEACASSSFAVTHKTGVARPTFRDYSCVVSKKCKASLANLALPKWKFLEAVENEFNGHRNYHAFDLESYPLVLRIGYIVLLTKIGNTFTFHDVMRCSANQAKMSAWNEALCLYRRAARLAYRTNPDSLMFQRGLAGRAIKLHREMINAIGRYYQDHAALPSVILPADITDRLDMPAPSVGAREIVSFLSEAARGCDEAQAVSDAIEQQDITENDALGLLVVALERSLQYIHKLILLHGPSAEASNGTE